MGLSVTFYHDRTVTVTDVKGNKQLLGTQSNNLYHSTPSFFNQQVHCVNNREYSLLSSSRSTGYLQTLWHNRLAHINDDYINYMIRYQLAKGIECPNIYNRKHCEACALSKIHRTSAFQTPGSNHRKERRKRIKQIKSHNHPSTDKIINKLKPFQKFAVDIKGPISPASIHNDKYALIFTCCATRYRFVYFLKAKDETYNNTRKFISDIRKITIELRKLILEFITEQYDESYIKSNHQFVQLLNDNKVDVTFTMLKSDNGTEFVNSEMIELMHDNNIHHQTTSPYTPHQNGIAERTNRTVFELASASLYASDTSIKLWPYAVKNVIHILNIGISY